MRATKLIRSLSSSPSYDERLRVLQLPTFRYRQLRGDMIQLCEEPRDPGPKHNEGKKPPPGTLPGYLWGPGVLLTASGTGPPASSWSS